ncbi:ABC transporter permease subunit [Pseudonocardia sp. RS010]|uniref:ABC transporter permease subunit n=1 Tax=Pseudonocardia sp. RS010 TaxID=3385979 RepID=UPI0039A21663
MGWLNTLTGVIVPQMTAPLAVLLRQHRRYFPRELLDAARMDGRSHWNTPRTVVVPSLRGPLAALAILLFVTAWNEYFWPLLVLTDPTSVVQIGLRGLITARTDYQILEEDHDLRLRHSWRSLAATVAGREDAARLDLPPGGAVMLREGVNVDPALVPTIYLRRRIRGDRIRFTMHYDTAAGP